MVRGSYIICPLLRCGRSPVLPAALPQPWTPSAQRLGSLVPSAGVRPLGVYLLENSPADPIPYVSITIVIFCIDVSLSFDARAVPGNRSAGVSEPRVRRRGSGAYLMQRRGLLDQSRLRLRTCAAVRDASAGAFQTTTRRQAAPRRPIMTGWPERTTHRPMAYRELNRRSTRDKETSCLRLSRRTERGLPAGLSACSQHR